MHVCLSTEWRVVGEHFNSLCNALPNNHQLIIDKLKTIPHLLRDEGEQLSKLITSSTDVRKINEKIITYLIIKLCYHDNITDLARWCNVTDEMIDCADIPTCVQRIICGMHINNRIHCQGKIKFKIM